MLERKHVEAELKAVGENEFEGYGSVFGNVDQGGDVIEPGAFGNLGSRKVRMLRDHDPAKVIGAWTSIEVDGRGLRLKGRFAATPLGQETRELVRMGAMDGLSIGYRTQDADRRADGARALKRIDLWEVSVVTFPMNEAAQIDAVKAMAEGDAAPLKRVVERSLREAGFSRHEAKAAAAAAATKVMGLREAGNPLAELAAFMRGVNPAS